MFYLMMQHYYQKIQMNSQFNSSNCIRVVVPTSAQQQRLQLATRIQKHNIQISNLALNSIRSYTITSTTILSNLEHKTNRYKHMLTNNNQVQCIINTQQVRIPTISQGFRDKRVPHLQHGEYKERYGVQQLVYCVKHREVIDKVDDGKDQIEQYRVYDEGGNCFLLPSQSLSSVAFYFSHLLQHIIPSFIQQVWSQLQRLFNRATATEELTPHETSCNGTES